MDSHGRIAFVNSAAEKMFGYEQGELENEPVEILIAETLREGHVKQVANFFREPRTGTMAADRELFGRRKDGSSIALQIGLSSIRSGERRFAARQYCRYQRAQVDRKDRAKSSGAKGAHFWSGAARRFHLEHRAR